MAFALALGLICMPAVAMGVEAEPGEDESVDDIEASVPRGSVSSDDPHMEEAGAAAGERETAASGQPQTDAEPNIVAPNIDLKLVAPPPEPIKTVPETLSGATDDTTATETPTDSSKGPVSRPVSSPSASKLVSPDSAGTVPELNEPPAPDDVPANNIPPGSVTEVAPESEPARAEPLRLLGAEVLPGTSTRLAWSPNIAISGLAPPTPVLVVNGEQPGPTLCLTGAVHGDELNGIEIVRRMVYDLEPDKLSGRVIGVPIVNVQGFQQGSRYLPDRRDLNRHFPGHPDGSLADRIAHSLFEEVVRHCDMLVDIHTGSLKRTNLPQLRADMNDPDVAEFTRGFDAMAVVHSSGSAGMLRTAAVRAGIVAVTMEAGESLRVQDDQIDAGVHSLTSLMERHGMISRLFVWGKPEPVYYDSQWIRAGHGGILFSDVKLGDLVTTGQILGVVADPITNAQHPVRSPRDGRVIGMAVDQVVMAGFAAYHIGAKAEVPGEE
ncbi:succinylglutamate desuccinylase/aspartoacylase family protein [Marinobacter salicampi]|uniref:succinylglutamate desuccinylase/aspartoacylase family protein n=1 Tax=Marinobacter salicampi TaxID=435907 RepID=UPI001F5F0014|nr:succinylglutamate desuccinylase/aspartoacylase family protein [Marinobacter salicampi]